MPEFTKVLKTRAYFKRFQVKYRRRREGKTDYSRRTKLVKQDKNKFGASKYRLVVRVTSRDVVCQVVAAKIRGDVTLTAAYAHELPRYGVSVGLTNYAACYATGLLCARRLLTKLGLADKYEGCVDVTGDDYYVEALDDGPNPFYCLLDVGLARTSTGARVFAAMKGAADGGLEIPHGESRLAGYDPEGKQLHADTLRKYIFGGHVADYMRLLKDDDDAAYKRQFSRYIKAGLAADDLEAMYKKCHAAIRADPKHVAKRRTKPTIKNMKFGGPRSRNLKQRKNRIAQKVAAHEKRLASDDDE